jgi:diaminohydroxyphosphoribosylaminopyrimidine deaminase/5-amino-6-(5-phosphoribosylamino)uracil reductase
MEELQAVRHALGLAWRGWGQVHPNPMVGAVLLKDGRMLAEGWHGEFGGPHAEAIVLGMARDRARGATLVVTLEPCRHHGKQPPCTEAILAAGIRRVAFGARDPVPESGGGAEDLRAAGLDVVLLPVSTEVEEQNAAFFHRARVPERPWVALKLATSVDGRVADFTGRSRWISGPEARAWVHWLRAGFDAVAVGGRTARADDPSLTVRGPIVPRVPPRRVVFDRRAELDGARQLLHSARDLPVTVVCEDEPSPASADVLARAGVDVLQAADLADGLRGLREQGVGALLVEGGGRLAGRLMARGLVDRFYWVQSPLWLGEDGLAAFGGFPGLLLEQAARWRVVDRKPMGSDTLLVLDRPPIPGP